MTISPRFRTSLLLSTAIAGCLLLGSARPAAAQTPIQTVPQTKSHIKPHKRTHTRTHKPAQSSKVAQLVPQTPGSPSGSVSAAPFGAPQNNATAAAAIQSSGAPASAKQDSAESVTVTGSILRNPNLSGANPVTHLSALDLQRRGITTVAEALQTVTANGSGNLPQNFTGNGAFAAGASGVSLRGLTTDSTLVLIDGQRAAYYPLSDDGERNFVDTNTIPESIIQSIDVQQDGGSATYGADAVAGVVNIITKKQIQGFEGGAEGGLTQRGDAGHQRLYATYGYGDLNRDNFNVWVNGEYQQDDLLMNNQRGYPFDSGNLTGIGGTNGNPNGVNADGSFVGLDNAGPGGATRVAQVRPVTVGADGTLTPVGLIQPINPALGCNGLTTHVVTGVGTVCEQNQVGDYGVIQPSDRRISSTIKATVNLGDNAQGYAMFTYSQNQVVYPETPRYITDHSRSSDANLINIVLPVRLANGQLNPNDPFAAQGYAAQPFYLFGDLNPTAIDFNQVLRGSSGVNGTVLSHWGGDWHYNVGFVGMVDTLRRTFTGTPTFQGIIDAVNTGSYNFVDPSQNSAATRAAIAPTDVNTANSQEYALDVVVSKGLFKLPGGMTTLGLGGSARYESLYDPSASPDDPSNPNTQYLRNINPFFAFGQRKVGSTFFELGVPVIKQLTLDVSGRYDNYSEGFDNFAPKVGVIIKPIQELTFRGTYSKGFRVPSFAETGGVEVGYTTSPPLPASFLALHQNAAGTAPDAYATAPQLGFNTVGNPNLKPEHSDNFNGGVIVQPKPWVSLSADYYYIKKKDYIVAADPTGAISDYYAGLNPSNVTADVVDPDHPTAMPRAGLVSVGYINAASLSTDGFDLQLSTNTRLPGPLRDIRWISSGTVTYVNSYNINFGGGDIQHYAGTLGPIGVTSGSGTPRWRTSWLNTFLYKKLTVGVATYFTSGYKTTAEDATGPGTANNCADAQQGFAGDPQNCRVNGFWDVDLTFDYALNDRLHLYTNVYNVGDSGPPLDTGTYGSYQYNPAWAAAGILGRSFRFGVTGKF